MVYDQFMLFGDSLFQHSSSQERGFTLAPALQSEYIRRLDVVNRGFSGYNTDQALKILPDIIPAPSQATVRFLVIFLGANDACLPNAPGGQHVPLPRFRSNLRALITHPSVRAQNPRIILITPPPINEYLCEENDRLKGYNEPRRKAEHTALYAQTVRDVAEELDGEGKQWERVVLLDFFKVVMEYVGQKDRVVGAKLEGSKERPMNAALRMLLHDGLHFTHIAYTLLFSSLMQTIERVWPDQTPEKLPFVLPAWNDLDAWAVKDDEEPRDVA